jgi:hypothetical protein
MFAAGKDNASYHVDDPVRCFVTKNTFIPMIRKAIVVD